MAYRPPNSTFAAGPDRLGFSGASRNPLAYTPSRHQPMVEQHSLGELEGILQRQRNKFREIKDKLQQEVDNERKVRIQFENKLIKLKDQFSKKDLQISELEFRENNILHQNQDLLLENDRLRSELARLEEVYGAKVFDLENQLNVEARNFQETTMQYNTEFEKFKKEGQEYIETLTFEYDRKIKNLEQKLKQSENSRKDLALENKKLADMLSSSKIAYEQEIRDISNRMRDEQQKKTQFLTRTFEQKARGLEEAKESLNRRCQEYLRSIQDKDRIIQEMENDKNDQINKLRQQITDLANKNNQISFLYDKVRAQLQEKDALIGRASGESSQEVAYLRQQIEQKKRDIDALNQSLRELRQSQKDMTADFERKRAQLLQRCQYFENEARRYKDEYTRICDTLKSKINDTISKVSYDKQR